MYGGFRARQEARAARHRRARDVETSPDRSVLWRRRDRGGKPPRFGSVSLRGNPEGDALCPAATNRLTPTNKSGRLSTLRKATKAAGCRRGRPNGAPGQPSIRKPVAANGPAVAAASPRTMRHRAKGESLAARQPLRGRKQHAQLRPKRPPQLVNAKPPASNASRD